MTFAQTFLGLIANTPAPPGLFNPWVARNSDDTAASGPFERRLRLEYHLSAPEVRFVAVGEAPGYQGARISGIPFTSEALLLDGAIPRVNVQHRLSQRGRPWSEPSARILWELLYRYGMAEHTVLWNACPYHPYADTALSNRAPSMGEVRLGLPMLECLRDFHPRAGFLAIGNKASDALVKLGIAHTPMRHPAYGGKNELEQQIKKLHQEAA